jgi:RNA polymerase sigma factor (TIGR02999 family)
MKLVAASLPLLCASVILGRMSEVTRILNAIEQGDPQAASQLLPLVYDELRQLAAQQLAREKPGQTLQPTALVHEAYLRLVGNGEAPNWNSRGHFFAAVAEAMRRILVENARRKGRLKHGGGRRREHADLDALHANGPAPELLALHEALKQLAAHEPLKAKLVELRFFAGLTLEQAAECLDISLSTADRAWRYARAWLYHAIAGADSEKK